MQSNGHLYILQKRELQEANIHGIWIDLEIRKRREDIDEVFRFHNEKKNTGYQIRVISRITITNEIVIMDGSNE